ncbi:3-phenylpropionate/trans-cinnamate dioxygenase ferredoxin reductase subunit [Williamsia limnetica]|uniref:3-phenylpropionate/trans-cinnamate dioxygenase ferredoxin reductase subunit n=1 Tax=Williamsia limnetica TaxID=882452 RepID=A0A318RLY7_WILLI|nr:FAD-dependent oxidoreductase [Williamsia limnetica]PYE19322.1 3-phenylpropionate/trans-cinnamate dioxygenase ferredoxin reductase subunit [Williamsia limnetica]
MTGGVAIVGSSHAGVNLAASLRALGYASEITIFGEESSAPYQRPPLSKKLMTTPTGPLPVPLRSPAFFESRAINVVLGTRVLSVDRATGLLETSQQAQVPFDRVALATGARARKLDVPGGELTGVHYLRTLEDAGQLRQHACDASSAVIIGGGFVGLEVASSLSAAGKSVTVLESSTQLMGRSLTATTAGFFEKVHRSAGVDLHLCARVDALVGQDGDVMGVRLADGTEIPADLVVAGIGAVPRTDLAQQMGLELADGIVVDEYARASDPRVVAIGDAAVFPHPLRTGGRTRLESVQNADEQATIAANTLLGNLVPYTSAPWFWSDQFGFKLQMVGAPKVVDLEVVRGSPDGDDLSVLLYSSGRIVGGEFVNCPADFVAVRKAIGAGTHLPPEMACDPGVPLKSLL